MALTFSYRGRLTDLVEQDIYRIKLNYRIIDKLYLRSFYQINNRRDKLDDTQRKLTAWNSLLQYEFFAGSNLYFVLNLQKDNNLEDHGLFENAGKYFKFAYEVNF